MVLYVKKKIERIRFLKNISQKIIYKKPSSIKIVFLRYLYIKHNISIIAHKNRNIEFKKIFSYSSLKIFFNYTKQYSLIKNNFTYILK